MKKTKDGLDVKEIYEYMKKVKLKEIYVDGYKNLIDCKANLNDFNVLVGPNNSGKSNFLEIFSFLGDMILGSDENKKSIFQDGMTERGFSSVCYIDDHRCKPITISLLLEDCNDKKDIRDISYMAVVQCSSLLFPDKGKRKVGFLKEELSIKYRKKTGRPTLLMSRKEKSMKVRSRAGYFSKKYISNDLSVLKAVPALYKEEDIDDDMPTAAVIVLSIVWTKVLFPSADELRKMIGHGEKVPPVEMRTTSFDLISAISDINKSKILFSEFKNVLCQILDLEDMRVSSVKVPKDIRKDSKDMPEVINFLQLKLPGQPFADIRNFSDGTLTVIAILIIVLLPMRRANFLCIEEPENCLHPKALKTLLSYLIQKSADMPILITTHSQFILSNVNIEDVIVARICKDGGTQFEKIKNIKELHKRLAKGYINFGDLFVTDFKEEEMF